MTMSLANPKARWYQSLTINGQVLALGYLKSTLSVFLALLLIGCVPHPSSPDPGVIGDGQFENILEEIVRDRNIPALSVAIVQDNEVIESASVGKRSLQATIPVTETDLWQIGSVTKAMTATLAARLVDLGMLRWDTRIDESLTQHLQQINSKHHSVTLTELLHHRSGLERHPLPTIEEASGEDRLGFLLRALERNPKSTRGEFSYSNLGYVAAGVMVEQATGMTWENAMESYLLSELGIVDYGFGVPDAGETLAQPLGHLRRTSSNADRVNDYWLPITRENDQLLPDLMVYGPAGSMYISKQDYQKFQQMHLDGANGLSGFLSQNSFDQLQQPGIGSEYAMGWFREDSEIFEDVDLPEGERVLAHGGSIGSWSANSILLPDRNTSILVTVNSVHAGQMNILEILLKRLQIIGN